MAKHLYVFIDETGDVGDGTGDSSSYYGELALAVKVDCLPDLNKHLLNWRYCRRIIREMTRPPKHEDAEAFLNPFPELCRNDTFACSCVYLQKHNYLGPYLKPKESYNPIKFRNYVHRLLLEWHFTNNHPMEDEQIEIVFDRFDMSKEDEENLTDYLQNNWNLPSFKHIVHADSKYVETLQLTHQFMGLMKDVIMGSATFSIELLDFVKIKDITKGH
jgi:hypothetical protein